MRVLLFHGEVESLNHFTDHANAFLRKIGCETLVCTLPSAEEEEAALIGFWQEVYMLLLCIMVLVCISRKPMIDWGYGC